MAKPRIRSRRPSAEIIHLRPPLSAQMASGGALERALSDARSGRVRQLIVMMEDHDQDLTVITSDGLSRESALWFAEQLRLYALGFE